MSAAGPKNVQSVSSSVRHICVQKRSWYLRREESQVQNGRISKSHNPAYVERLAGTSITSGERISLQLSLLRVDIVGRWYQSPESILYERLKVSFQLEARETCRTDVDSPEQKEL